MRARLLFAIVVTVIGVPLLFVNESDADGKNDGRSVSRSAQPTGAGTAPPAAPSAATPSSVTPPPATPSRAAPAAPSAASAAPGKPAHPAGAAGAVPGDPAAVPVVAAGRGTFTQAAGGGARSGAGPLKRYTVRVEDGIGVDPAQFAAAVDATLADPRSWGAGGKMSFQRVTGGPVEFTVTLASPATADRLCAPLDTTGIYSCGNGSAAVINAMRWLRGADAYTGRLPEYRQYVINHEVGHTLGRGHQGCTAAGRQAPVMMQQTKGVGACVPYSWPNA